MDGKEIIRELKKLESNRVAYEVAWEDCRAYVLPESLPITGETIDPGQKSTKNYNSTAELAARDLASNLMASITSPSTKWIQLESDDNEINENDEEAKQYFEDVEEVVNNAIDNSNCYQRLHEFYKSLVVFGTGIFHLEKGRGGEDLNAYTVHVSEMYLAENHKGFIDTVFRKVKMTPKQLAQRFGLENLSDPMKNKYQRDKYQDVDIVHAVFPREDREMDSKGNFRTDKKNMPFVSIWVEYTTKHVISESGYRTFPFAAARWSKECGQVYGHGPVIECLSDIRVLNAMEKSRLHLAEKVANPPIGIKGCDVDEISFEPGEATALDNETEVVWLVPGANYPITDAAFREKKDSVMDALYANKLYNINMLEKEMTAAEVNARKMENLRILGPVYSNIQSEFLETFVTRVIDILEADGKLPPAPQSLKGKEYRFRFINPLALAQKHEETQVIERVLSGAIQLAQVKPEILDIIDFDKAFRIMIDNSGADYNIVADDKTIKQIRKTRADQQAQQQQIQMLMVQKELQEGQAKAQDRQASAELKRRREK